MATIVRCADTLVNVSCQVNLYEGEGHKEGARRWLRQQHGLALLDVETSHIVRREVEAGSITRSAIAVVVRREKLKQWAGSEGVFIAVDKLTARGLDISADVRRDAAELNTFLVPWIKTAGKNGSAC